MNLYSEHNIDYRKRSQSWYPWDFYQTNHLEIKLTSKNSTQSFCFGLKFLTLLKINGTSNFSQTNSFWDKLGRICSRFK